MKELLLLAVLGLGAYWISKQKCKSDYDITLDNIRRGIAEGWYTAELLAMQDQSGIEVYYVQLTGKDTNGQVEQTVQQISKATFDALKAEGVPQIV